jgi:hypothetical protein
MRSRSARTLVGETGGKLTTLVLGSDQERALRLAATAAVRLTAEELRPDNGEQAEHAALVISQVFNEPVPDAPLVLEALHAGSAGQLAVLESTAIAAGPGKQSARRGILTVAWVGMGTRK